MGASERASSGNHESNDEQTAAAAEQSTHRQNVGRLATRSDELKPVRLQQEESAAKRKDLGRATEPGAHGR